MTQRPSSNEGLTEETQPGTSGVPLDYGSPDIHGSRRSILPYLAIAMLPVGLAVSIALSKMYPGRRADAISFFAMLCFSAAALTLAVIAKVRIARSAGKLTGRKAAVLAMVFSGFLLAWMIVVSFFVPLLG